MAIVAWFCFAKHFKYFIDTSLCAPKGGGRRREVLGLPGCRPPSPEIENTKGELVDTVISNFYVIYPST
jgi:hypothetical protein